MITKTQALDALKKAVDKYGADTLYRQRDEQWRRLQNRGDNPSCRYVDRKGRPLCLVGVAMVEFLGVDPTIFTPQLNKESVGSVATKVDELMDDKALRVFSEAQAAQDAGHTWGTSLARAKKV